MPPYLTNWEAWKAFVPLPVTVLLLTAIFFAVARPKEHKSELAILLAAFLTLGLATGYMTGFSRSPAVGAVLPAALSLVGGLGVFLAGREATSRKLVGLLVLCFATTLLLGTGWGATMRQASEEYDQGLNAQKLRAIEEIEIREFRESLGLPAEAKRSEFDKDHVGLAPEGR